MAVRKAVKVAAFGGGTLVALFAFSELREQKKKQVSLQINTQIFRDLKLGDMFIWKKQWAATDERKREDWCIFLVRCFRRLFLAKLSGLKQYYTDGINRCNNRLQF